MTRPFPTSDVLEKLLKNWDEQRYYFGASAPACRSPSSYESQTGNCCLLSIVEPYASPGFFRLATSAGWSLSEAVVLKGFWILFR